MQHVLEEMTDAVVSRALEARTYPGMNIDHRAAHVRHAHGAHAQAVRQLAFDARGLCAVVRHAARFRTVQTSPFGDGEARHSSSRLADFGSSAKRASTFSRSPAFLRKSAT